MSKTRKPTLMDRVMAEPIRMPGCPQMIVTRGFAYQWLKRMGYSTDARGGFGTVDSMVFGGPNFHPATEPLTDMAQDWVRNVLAAMEGDLSCAS